MGFFVVKFYLLWMEKNEKHNSNYWGEKLNSLCRLNYLTE